jgi:hypothetical protein
MAVIGRCFTTTTNTTSEGGQTDRQQAPRQKKLIRPITLQYETEWWFERAHEAPRSVRTQTEQENKREGPSFSPSQKQTPKKGSSNSRIASCFFLLRSVFFLLFSSHSVQTARTIHKRREEQEAISLAGKWIAVLAGLCTAHGTSSSFRSLLPSFASFVRHNNGTRKPIKR